VAVKREEREQGQGIFVHLAQFSRPDVLRTDKLERPEMMTWWRVGTLIVSTMHVRVS
jgi:hypothetical protein